MKKTIIFILTCFLVLTLVACNKNSNPSQIIEGDFVFEIRGDDKILQEYLGDSLEVIIPDGTTEIGKYAFKGKDITSLTIPTSVVKYEHYSYKIPFVGFNMVKYLGTLEQWFNIDFVDKIVSDTGVLYVDGKEIAGTLIIPEGVPEIKAFTLNDNGKLKSVIIPASVRKIGFCDGTFDSVEEVHY